MLSIVLPRARLDSTPKTSLSTHLLPKPLDGSSGRCMVSITLSLTGIVLELRCPDGKELHHSQCTEPRLDCLSIPDGWQSIVFTGWMDEGGKEPLGWLPAACAAACLQCQAKPDIRSPRKMTPCVGVISSSFLLPLPAKQQRPSAA